VGACGRQHRVQRYARAARGPCAVEEPVHVWSLRAREPGDLMAACLGDGRAGRSGKAEAVRLRCTVMRSGQAGSTCEPAEQGRSAGGGGGGGKRSGQGERGQRDMPRTQSRCERAKRAGSCAPSRKAGQEGAVHRAPAPRRSRPSAGGLLGAEPEGRDRGGRDHVAGLRAGSRSEPSRSACPRPPGRLPSETVAAGVHPGGGRAAATVGRCRTGGQAPSARRRLGTERRL